MADAKKTDTRAMFRSLGTGGVRRSGGYIADDIIPRLNSTWGAARAFREMSLNDPIIFGINYALTMISRRIKWRVEPNKETKDAKASKDAAEWLSGELFDRIKTPWADVIADTATKFAHGFAPLEKTYVKREDGRIGIESIALRSQDTIERWELGENGEVLGLWQQDPNVPKSVFIPVEKLLNMRTTPERGNPQGLSLLRGAYIYHVRQKAIEEAEARAALRSAGIVVLRVPGEILEPSIGGQELEIRNQFEALGLAISEDRQGYVMMSSQKDDAGGGFLYDINYLVADGQRSTDMTPIIERMEKRKAGSVLADFMLLGQQGTGSFAMHEDKTSLFQEAITGFADIDEGEFNRHLVTPLWKLNGFPDETKPRVVHGALTKPDLTLIADFVDRMTQRGYMSPTQEVGDHMADLAEVPRSKVAPNPPPAQPMPGAQPPGGAPGDAPEKAADKAPDKTSKRDAPAQTKPADAADEERKGPGGASRPGAKLTLTKAADDDEE